MSITALDFIRATSLYIISIWFLPVFTLNSYESFFFSHLLDIFANQIWSLHVQFISQHRKRQVADE